MKAPVVKTRPLVEILASKLFGIESVPPAEARRMVKRAIKAAVEYVDTLGLQRDTKPQKGEG